MDFSTLKSEVLRRLEEAIGSPDAPIVVPVVFSTTELEEAINEGYENLSERSEWFETSETLSISTQYTDLRASLASEFLSITRAYNSTNNHWLTWTDIRELEELDSRWDSPSANPERMFLRGITSLGLYPKPSAATSIKIYYTALPARLSAATDTPAFPQEFHDALISYAMYDLLFQDGEMSMALIHWNEYLRGEAELRSWARDRTWLDREKIYGGDLVSARI